MENYTNSIQNQKCIVKVFKGIPIQNNEYNQYLKLDEANLDLVRKKLFIYTFHKK